MGMGFAGVVKLIQESPIMGLFDQIDQKDLNFKVCRPFLKFGDLQKVRNP